ncbi:MAG: hypothetical protein IKT72_00600 [Clostridia bacterium]|nr:hypothetical protein [Clostridia bacterium]
MAERKPKNRPSPTAPQRLKLLCLIVNRAKAEFYVDFLQGFEINLELALAAKGTADAQMLRLLGLAETEKAILFGVVREDRAGDVLSALEEKFDALKNGKGVAFTVPMAATIGVAVYQFLCNNRKYLETKGDRT